MKKINAVKIWVILFSLGMVLTACTHTVQTSSGKAYLARYPTAETLAHAPEARAVDQEVAALAAVEPTLRFPARIGLAKIERGQLAALSREEARLWFEAMARLGSDFGEFAPISQLVAEMVAPTQGRKRNVAAIVRAIRLAAARQHLDVVLIYEIHGDSSRDSNPLSLLDLTIIGAYLAPGQSLSARGVAQALLVDVRNGYPYGTAQGVANDEGLSTRVGARQRQQNLYQKAVLAATRDLVRESEAMFRRLRHELSTRDLTRE